MFDLDLVKDNPSSQLVTWLFFHGLWWQIPPEGASSSYWCSCYSVCLSLSYIYLPAKSLTFQGEKGMLFGEKMPLSITHTFIFQSTQVCLGIPGSHFELFPFTNYNLCSLNILLNLLQPNYFCISNCRSVCPSGSLIFFPAYFLGVPFAVISVCLPRGKNSACRLNCLEYLGEQQQVWGQMEEGLLKNIKWMSVGKCCCCDHLCIDICLL